MSGSAFIGAFLFETPFALMTGGAGWIVLLRALSFLYLFVKTYKKYAGTLKSNISPFERSVLCTGVFLLLKSLENAFNFVSK
ncbi:hypothetical protein AU387_03655 [Bacillus halotolerans]|nr:hypothetical protein AU387_03655 [Bacillus halotolerans]